MTPPVRLFGTDREEIIDLQTWFDHAPPEKGLAQWRDGYSAKEQAKAWLRPGHPAVPDEFWLAIRPLAGNVDEFYARPEHRTRLDRFARARQHDLFACARVAGATSLVIGVEAKACENFDGIVADRASSPPPSKKRDRCNLLARALFGRSVVDEPTGELLDPRLAGHGYQLWTAAVGTIIEAQARGMPNAVLVVQQFRPDDLDAAREAGDKRAWRKALDANELAFADFVDALSAAGSESHETEFVHPGTKITAIKIETQIDTEPRQLNPTPTET
jgi:hypothetical protein